MYRELSLDQMHSCHNTTALNILIMPACCIALNIKNKNPVFIIITFLYYSLWSHHCFPGASVWGGAKGQLARGVAVFNPLMLDAGGHSGLLSSLGGTCWFTIELFFLCWLTNSSGYLYNTRNSPRTRLCVCCWDPFVFSIPVKRDV